MKRITGIILSLVSTLLFVTPALATSEQSEKVSICHATASENNPYVSVEVDKDAWDEHSSAHSDHVNDFLITEETPCPPEEPEIKDQCKNLDGLQVTVPDGYHVEKCNCIKDETPPEEEEPPVVVVPPTVATPSSTPKEKTPPELPQTGEGLLWLLIGPIGTGLGIVGKFALRNK